MALLWSAGHDHLVTTDIALLWSAKTELQGVRLLPKAGKNDGQDGRTTRSILILSVDQSRIAGLVLRNRDLGIAPTTFDSMESRPGDRSYNV